MEQVGAEPNLIYSTLHTKAYNHTIGTQKSAQRLVPTQLHRLPSLPARLAAQFDHHRGRRSRHLASRSGQPGDGKAQWPFDAPFDLILNLAIGGDWAGQKGIDDAALPQRMAGRLRPDLAELAATRPAQTR